VASKSLRFVLIANWIFACFLSFTTVLYWDEDTPLPVSAGIIVREWDQKKSANELRADIERFAIENQITLGRSKSDFGGKQRGRTLYVVDGDPSVPAGEWLRGNYRDFTGSLTTTVRPFSEAGDRAPTGPYAVFGDYSKAQQLAAYFRSEGMTITRQFDRWSLDPRNLFLQDEQVSALGMMMLVSIAVAAAGALVSARAYGVKRLQGLGFGSLLGYDLRASAGYWFGAGAASVGAALGLLAVYNGLTGLTHYLITAFVINALLLVAAIGAHALVLLLLMRLRVLAAVKGELPGRTASTVAYVLRVVTVLATLVLAQQVIATGVDVDRRSDALAEYVRAGNTSKVNLGDVWSKDDAKTVLPLVGGWLRKEDAAGNVILAARTYLQDKDSPSGTSLMYVNERYLRDHPITLEDGTRFTGASEPVMLLAPAFWEGRDRLAASLAEPGSELRESVRFKQLRTAANQQVFTYSSRSVGPRAQGNVSADESFVTDPVVVFLPSAQGLLKDANLAALASQGRVLFPDPAVVSAALAADPALGTYVKAVTPVQDQAAEEHRVVVQKFRLSLFSALAGMLVLIITGIGAVLIHSRRNAQWIFARHVSGWRFTTIHRVLLIFEAVALVVLVGWLPYQSWKIDQTIAEISASGLPAPMQPMVLGTPEWVATALLATLTVAGVLIALARAHRRVVRDGASEA
jgi:hypothetical protein